MLPPGQGHAAAVASLVPAVREDVQRILATLGRYESLLEAELLALVDEVLTGQAQQQESRGLRPVSTDTVAAEAGHVPDDVVVRLRPARQRRAARNRAPVDVDPALPRRRLPAAIHHRERHVKLVLLDVARLPAGVEDLADKHALRLVRPRDLTPVAIDVVDLGLVEDLEAWRRGRCACDAVRYERPVGQVAPLV